MGPGSQPPVSQTPGAGRRPRAHEGFRFAYAAVLGAAFVLAMLAGWTSLGRQIDNNAYDFMFRVYRPAPWPLSSIAAAAGIAESTSPSQASQARSTSRGRSRFPPATTL
jgi:hypothetical protein